ncbi:MAG: bifunctional 4-hydroxy-2-oxoglutarate aldolase/2-dehydro-3-deoxy-phosphogluconate aldolase [Planctomycetota bacterium]
MSTREDIVREVIDAAVVAVVRLPEVSLLRPVAEALLAGGVRGIEVTMTVPNALEGIRELAADPPDGLLLGVGSVLDADTAARAVEAGARYVVSPIFKLEVVRAAHAGGAAAMPGCFTPTEVAAASDAGADICKVFPADVLGMPFFKGVLAPMPHLRLMPTGGVTLDNAGDWLRAGAVAVGAGSALVDKKAITAGDFGAITTNAARIRASADAARTTHTAGARA